MGDIRRKRNLHSRPKRLFESSRIEEENKIKKKYGLKNKTEIWKASAKISSFRTRAKKLISLNDEKESYEFFNKLNNMGIEVKTTSDVLALTTEAILDRRLQTIVFKRGLSKTPLEARQLIVHKNIIFNDRVINIPSFNVPAGMENKISVKIKSKEAKDE